jgi:hypothetical protein
MPMKGTATSKNVYEKVKKAIQSLDGPVDELAGPMKVGEPGMGQERVTLHCFTVLSINVKNRTCHGLVKCHCLIHQENLYAKCLKMTNIITVLSKLVISLGQRE